MTSKLEAILEICCCSLKLVKSGVSGGGSLLRTSPPVWLAGTAVPEIIDPVFAKTSQNARFLLSEYERFGLVFTKTQVYKFGHR
jgi:hypothetical protein